MTDLPVEAVIPELAAALDRRRAAVLTAEPGAGKTTVVPLRLLDAPWLAGRKIVMLEPRRVAARAAARRLAANHGDQVGGIVGFRVRFSSQVSSRTRIEVVTEGVLTRLLDRDRELADYGLVIFDEFHERTLQGDLGLAFTLETRAVLRPDLRVLVMSATIDATPVARLIGDGSGPAPVIAAPGRVFPVETRYRPARPDQRLEALVAGTIREALSADPGDVLAFLPGVGEIRRVERFLADPPAPARVLSLHGTLPLEAQDAVLAPGGQRKVVLATAIAETSLTIPGVRVVVDGGRMRVPRFSPKTGMSRLETVRVTRASADQRRGRAGRTDPGVCYRLWAAAEEPGFLGYNQPEILAADLAGLALELAAAGDSDAARLPWLDPPPPAALAQARALLTTLGAIDDGGRITADGREMAGFPAHPRIAHLVVRARRAGELALAADLAALLGDRDPVLRPPNGEPADADLRLRVDALKGAALPLGVEVDRGAIRRLKDETREWRRRIRADAAPSDSSHAGRLLAWAYPDRVAQRRSGFAGRFLLRNGRGAYLPADQPLARADYIVAVELDDTGSEGRISLAAPLDPAEVAALAESEGRSEVAIEWDPGARAVRSVRRVTLGALVLSERPALETDPTRETAVFLDAIRKLGIAALPWPDAAARLRDRLRFARRWEGDQWPDVSDEALEQRFDEWLGPRLTGIRRFADLDSRIDWSQAILSLVSGSGRGRLDRVAPDRFVTPAGPSTAIDYTNPAAPTVSVRLQQMFGLTRHPSVVDGKVPLTLELLSPAGRPVQITRDLEGFWRSSYHDVRKDLRGRYPKHRWPEDPAAAPPRR